LNIGQNTSDYGTVDFVEEQWAKNFDKERTTLSKRPLIIYTCKYQLNNGKSCGKQGKTFSWPYEHMSREHEDYWNLFKRSTILRDHYKQSTNFEIINLAGIVKVNCNNCLVNDLTVNDIISHSKQHKDIYKEQRYFSVAKFNNIYYFCPKCSDDAIYYSTHLDKTRLTHKPCGEINFTEREIQTVIKIFKLNLHTLKDLYTRLNSIIFHANIIGIQHKMAI